MGTSKKLKKSWFLALQETKSACGCATCWRVVGFSFHSFSVYHYKNREVEDGGLRRGRKNANVVLTNLGEYDIIQVYNKEFTLKFKKRPRTIRCRAKGERVIITFYYL